MRNKILLVLMTILMLGGCSTTGDTKVVYDIRDTPIIHPPIPDKPKPKRINVEVYQIKDNDITLKEGFSDQHVIIMDIENFEKLGFNIKNIVEYASNLRSTIEYYRGILEPKKETSDDEHR